MSTVIKVENLSKRYRLGVINRDMFYKDLQSRWAKFRGKEDPNAPIGLKHDKRLEHGDEFWALRNVDLEVKEGEILGIIGRNGAGKSTLLKILSQITAPTEGKIKVKGRIASLLEVGTGFHPELTGRENVYLNGAILGMTRKEVRSKFDEIVAFADIHEFIDTPVKRYSSGMYVRLAFAVAAHLDPEILIVDEVLAVGDAEFQRKCLGKMREVSSKQGRTVLFVSHNIPSISRLCNKCICLSEGTIVSNGLTKPVLDAYFETSLKVTEEPVYARTDRKGTGALRFESVSLLGDSGHIRQNIVSGSAVNICIGAKLNSHDAKNVGIALGISTLDGRRICHLSNETVNQELKWLNVGINHIIIRVPEVNLAAGQYILTLFASVNGEVADWLQDAVVLSVEAGDFYNTGKIQPSTQGVFLMKYSFESGNK